MRNIRAAWIKLIVIYGVVFFLFGFANKRSDKGLIDRKEVVFTGDEDLFFLNQEMVNKLLIQNNYTNGKVTKDKVDLKIIEGFLDSHENIENAEVYLTVDGVFKAEIRQKKPLVRVVNEEFSYYIDSEGGFIPLSDVYTARVPIVIGTIEEVSWDDYMMFFKGLKGDSFLKKNIIGVEILDNGELVLKNRNFEYDLYFGKPEQIQEKFLKYKVFFNKAIQDSTIGKYKSINLKYAQQVVCAQ